MKQMNDGAKDSPEFGDIWGHELFNLKLAKQNLEKLDPKDQYDAWKKAVQKFVTDIKRTPLRPKVSNIKKKFHMLERALLKIGPPKCKSYSPLGLISGGIASLLAGVFASGIIINVLLAGI